MVDIKGLLGSVLNANLNVESQVLVQVLAILCCQLTVWFCHKWDCDRSIDE